MRTRGALDILTMLVLALPGTALGIAYIRAFNTPILLATPLANSWVILPIVLAVRRLPYTVRSSYSSLLVVHHSMEEAAESVGAGGLKTFKDITLPLIWKGVAGWSAVLFYDVNTGERSYTPSVDTRLGDYDHGHIYLLPGRHPWRRSRAWLYPYSRGRDYPICS